MNSRTQLRAVFLTALMVLSIFSMSIVGFSGSVAAQDDFQEVTDDGDLQVWERSVLPLRTDTDDAVYTIENHRIFINDPDDEQVNANRPEVGVYEPGTVNVSFRGVSGATTSKFDDDHGQLIVASFDKNRKTGDVAAMDDLSHLVDLALDGEMSQLQTEADNRDISFEIVEDDTQMFDSNGEFEHEISADNSGPYAVMAVRVDDGSEGFDDSSGTLELPGKATIVGVESFAVQQESSSVTAPGSVEPGDDIKLDASTNLDGDVNHTVVVYNEETYTSDSEQTIINITEGTISDFSSDDATIEHSIAGANGVQEVTEDGRMFGSEFSAQLLTGTTGFATLLDSLNDEANTNIQRKAIGTTEIDASGVVVPNAASSETITVGTYGNWSKGEYRILHVAENGTVRGVETDTRTITIEEKEDDSRSSRRRSRSRAPDPEVIDDPEDIDAPEDVKPTRAERAQITIDEETGQARVAFTEESATESITFGDSSVEGEVTVEDYETESEETGPSPGRSVSVVRITVPDPNRPATIRTRVSTERLNEIEANADELRMNRFSDGEWQRLETEVVDETDDRIVLESETPGFSWFSVSAVSEPEPSFDVTPAEPNAGDEVTFDASDSTNRHGEITSYEWSIDGETLTGETVSYTFEEGGDYDVTLTVENDGGETATEEQTVTVADEEEPPAEGPEDPDDPEDPEDPEELVDESSGFSGLSIAIVVLFIVAVLAAVLWFRRQQQ